MQYLRIFIVFTLLLAGFPRGVFAQDEKNSTETKVNLMSSILETGYVGHFFGGDFSMNIPPQRVKAGTLEIKRKYTREHALRVMPPPITHSMVSDVFEYSLIGIPVKEVSERPAIDIRVAKSTSTKLYFYDRNALSWRPLPKSIAYDGVISASSPFAYGLIVALEEISQQVSDDVVTRVRAAIVADERGAVLYAKDSTMQLPIASLTKLMTALVFLDHNPGWEKTIALTKKDAAHPANLNARIGEKFIVKDIFYVTLVGSRNNAAKMLARSAGLSREAFVAEMNAKARALGMTHTHFVDETGLHPGNQSTAEDFVRLVRAAFAHPDIVRASQTAEYTAHVLHSKRSYRISSTVRRSKSDLGVVSGKTGYTEEAGYTLALEVTKDARHIIVVVLGAPSSDIRFKAAEMLAQRAIVSQNLSRAK